MEELLQRLSTSKRVTWLMSQAVVLAIAGFYALMLALTTPSPDDGLFRFPDLGRYQTTGLCVVLALPILLVRRLPAAVFAAVLGESALGDIFGARPLVVFILLVALSGNIAARRPKAAAVGSVAGVAAAFVNDIHVSVGDAAQWAGWLALWFAVAWVFGGCIANAVNTSNPCTSRPRPASSWPSGCGSPVNCTTASRTASGSSRCCRERRRGWWRPSPSRRGGR
ncbi:hypothetical protein ACFZDJ_53380 [Streptomyces sp. NPDC007896]|uniref:hypothetical protein n=1 Tax=Streptomyces sp. NPDC007896 TaxID=3364784 RepID=UPI0036EF3E1D